MKGWLIRASILCVVILPWAAVSGANGITEQDAFDLGTQAYIYGYPLVTVEMTRRVMTNVAVSLGGRAPSEALLCV